MKRLKLLLKTTLFFILFINCGVSVSTAGNLSSTRWAEQANFAVFICKLTTPTKFTKRIKNPGKIWIIATVNDSTTCVVKATDSSGNPISIGNDTAHPNHKVWERGISEWPSSKFPITVTFTIKCREDLSRVVASVEIGSSQPLD